MARRPSPADGRAVVIEPVPDRTDRIGELYAGANRRMSGILALRSPAQLTVIDSFLAEVILAARETSDDLDRTAGEDNSPP